MTHSRNPESYKALPPRPELKLVPTVEPVQEVVAEQNPTRKPMILKNLDNSQGWLNVEVNLSQS